jgi:hypothetical protein
MKSRISRLMVGVILVLGITAIYAQGPPGRDPYNPPPGHGGTPPGQAKKHGQGPKEIPPGQAKKYDSDGARMPPGQAKKYFRDTDRDYFYSHYRDDAERWRGHRRPMFVPGRVIVSDYVVRPVPRAYLEGMVISAPPPGYQYGYCRGYVVVYNPTSRMVADVLDLIATAASR